MSRMMKFLVIVAVMSLAAAILSLIMALSLVFSPKGGGAAQQAQRGVTPELVSALPKPATPTLAAVSSPQPTQVASSPTAVLRPTLPPSPTPDATQAAAALAPGEAVDFALLAIREICLAERCDNQQVVRAGRKTLNPDDTAKSITDSWCLVVQYDSHGCFEEKKTLVVNVRQIKGNWTINQFNAWDFDKCMLPAK